MRFEQTFTVCRPPEVVFDYLTNPANLAGWQTAKTSVEQVTDGPPGLGTRIRERTLQPGGREYEQLEPDGEGTRVLFVCEGEQRGRIGWSDRAKNQMARQFVGYHKHLRDNVEAA